MYKVSTRPYKTLSKDNISKINCKESGKEIVLQKYNNYEKIGISDTFLPEIPITIWDFAVDYSTII